MKLSDDRWFGLEKTESLDAATLKARSKLRDSGVAIGKWGPDIKKGKQVFCSLPLRFSFLRGAAVFCGESAAFRKWGGAYTEVDLDRLLDFKAALAGAFMHKEFARRTGLTGLLLAQPYGLSRFALTYNGAFAVPHARIRLRGNML